MLQYLSGPLFYKYNSLVIFVPCFYTGNECEDTGRCDRAQMIFYEFFAGPEYGWEDLNPCDDYYINMECLGMCDSCEIRKCDLVQYDVILVFHIKIFKVW